MNGLLIGPYARQVTGDKLKFWFAFIEDDTRRHHRYEVAIDRYQKKPKARHRPIYPGRVPSHSSNFNDYRIPDDLSGLPELSFPRFPRDKLADAGISLLVGQDIADVTRLKLIGALPTRLAWQPNGDTPCTSKQPQLF